VAFHKELTTAGKRCYLRKANGGLISQRNGKPDPERATLVQENELLEEPVANLSGDNNDVGR
jgi:hypothetical protein